MDRTIPNVQMDSLFANLTMDDVCLKRGHAKLFEIRQQSYTEEYRENLHCLRKPLNGRRLAVLHFLIVVLSTLFR